MSVLTELYYKNAVIRWPPGSSAPDNADFQRIGKDFGAMLVFILGDASNVNRQNPSKLFDYWSVFESDPTAANKNKLRQSWQAIIDKYKDTTLLQGGLRPRPEHRHRAGRVV